MEHKTVAWCMNAFSLFQKFQFQVSNFSLVLVQLQIKCSVYSIYCTATATAKFMFQVTVTRLTRLSSQVFSISIKSGRANPVNVMRQVTESGESSKSHRDRSLFMKPTVCKEPASKAASLK